MSHTSNEPPHRTVTARRSCTAVEQLCALGPLGNGETALVSDLKCGLSHTLCEPLHRTVTSGAGAQAKEQECGLRPPPSFFGPLGYGETAPLCGPNVDLSRTSGGPPNCTVTLREVAQQRSKSARSDHLETAKQD